MRPTTANFRRSGGLALLLVAAGVFFAALPAGAAEGPMRPSQPPGPGPIDQPQPIPSEPLDLSFLPTIEDGGLAPADTPQKVANVLITAGLLTFLTLAPSMLILMTCFTRIVVVLGFLRRAMATNTLPPDQLLMGLALFLTAFIMWPTWKLSWENGVSPYLEQKVDPELGRALTQAEMLERALAPQRHFMFTCLEDNEGTEEVLFFLGASGRLLEDREGAPYYLGADGRKVYSEYELKREDIPTVVLIPAFVTAELRRAFWMGFLLYLPFLVVDMVIASVLMSMGMMMLPPVMISLPFKIIMFVLVDGWSLVMQGLVTSFPKEVYTALQAVD